MTGVEATYGEQRLTGHASVRGRDQKDIHGSHVLVSTMSWSMPKVAVSLHRGAVAVTAARNRALIVISQRLISLLAPPTTADVCLGPSRRNTSRRTGTFGGRGGALRPPMRARACAAGLDGGDIVEALSGAAGPPG